MDIHEGSVKRGHQGQTTEGLLTTAISVSSLL